MEARRAGLTFIKLDGNVGCVVNGAGLAMATMDLVKYYGGEPANFLDIGGSSNPGEGRQRAQDHHRRSRASRRSSSTSSAASPARDDVANGIKTALAQFPVKVPIVVRLTGTNEQEAVKILAGDRDDGAVRHGRGRAAGRRAGRGGGVSIFIDHDTRLVVQGITGRDGSFHAKQMIEYGTNVVAGVTPGKGGQRFEGTVPIFNTVAEAVAATGRQHLGHLRAAGVAAGAIAEAADAGIKLVVCITEGIPVLDMMRVMPFVREKGARLIGPNCPGAHHAGPGQGRASSRARSARPAGWDWCPEAARSPTRWSTS